MKSPSSPSAPNHSAVPMIPIIEKLTHINQLDLLAVKYQQAAIESKDENKALQMQKYHEWLHSASKYIIVQYERSEVATRLNMDMIRTVAWQEDKIKQLEAEIIKLKKVIDSL